MMKKLLFIDNTAYHLFTQRHLFNEFASQGYNIVLCCPDDGDYFSRMKNDGFDCVPLKIHGKSKNPINNLLLIIKLYKIVKQICPDLIFSFTIKPNLYSSIIGRWLRVPVVPNITGLGTVFLEHNIVTIVVIWLYKFAFCNLNYIVLQNKDDKKTFIDMNLVSKKANLVQVPGSGVNLQKFPFVGYTNTNEFKVTFLYIGRLLWDKGIGELIEAFKSLKKDFPYIKLKLIGNYFNGNPSAIDSEQVKKWETEAGIQYLGMVDNVSEIIASCDCIVLPSYREGMPRAILEASSMGKPVITTNAIGCCDSVDDNITGLICNVKDSRDLAKKMQKFIELPLNKKQIMGIAGRKKMEDEFDQKIVIDHYKFIVRKLL